MNTAVHAKITVVKRNGTNGSQYPITSSTCMFGKDASCEIRIQLPSVSNVECKLEKDENGLFTLKLINANGDVMVNNQTIKSHKSINHDDILSIGGRSFKFEYPPNVMYNSQLSSTQKMKNPQLTAFMAQQSLRLKRVSFGPQLSPEQFASFLPADTPVKKGAIPLKNLDDNDDGENAENFDPNRTPVLGASANKAKNQNSGKKRSRSSGKSLTPKKLSSSVLDVVVEKNGPVKKQDFVDDADAAEVGVHETLNSNNGKSRSGSLGRIGTSVPTTVTAKTLHNDTVPIEEPVDVVMRESSAAASPLLNKQESKNEDMKMGNQSGKKRKRSSVIATTPPLTSEDCTRNSIALDDTIPIESVEDKSQESNNLPTTPSPVLEVNGQTQESLEDQRKSLGNRRESTGSRVKTPQKPHQTPVANTPTEEIMPSLDESYLENGISHSSFADITIPVQEADEIGLEDARTTTRSSHRRRSKKRTSPEISSSPSIGNLLNDTIPMESLEDVDDDEVTLTPPKAVKKSSSKKQRMSARKRRRTRSISKPMWSEIVKNVAAKKIPLLKSQQLAQHYRTQKEIEESSATPDNKSYHHIFSPATIYIGRSKKLRSSDAYEFQNTHYPDGISLGNGKFDDSFEGNNESNAVPSDLEVSISSASCDVMVVSESHSRIKNKPVEENFGTRRLMKTPKDKIKNAPVEKNFGTRRLMKTPKDKIKNEPVEKNFGTRRLMKTPRAEKKNEAVSENFGTKRLMKTPKSAKNKPIEEHFGTKRLLKTPREKKNEPVEKHFGIRRVMKTPKVKKNEAVENKFGTKRLLTTPKEKIKNQPVKNYFGTKRLLTSPKQKIKNSPVASYLGLNRLMAEAKNREDFQIAEDEFGLEELFKSPITEQNENKNKKTIVMECQVSPTILATLASKTRSSKRKRMEMKKGDEDPSAGVSINPTSKTKKMVKMDVVQKHVRFLSPVKTLNTETKTRRGSANKTGSATVVSSDKVDAGSSSAPLTKKTTSRKTKSKLKENHVANTNKSDGNTTANEQALSDGVTTIAVTRKSRRMKNKVEKSKVDNETGEVPSLAARDQNGASESDQEQVSKTPVTSKGSRANKNVEMLLQIKSIQENEKLVSSGRSTRSGSSSRVKIELKNRSKRPLVEAIKENPNKKNRKTADVNAEQVASLQNHTAGKAKPDVTPVRRSCRIAKQI